jgi:hypothetical protein
MIRNSYTSTRDWLLRTYAHNGIHHVYREYYTNEVVQFTTPKGDPPQWVDWVVPPQFGRDHKFDKSYISLVEYGSVRMNELGEGMVFVMTPTHKLLRDMVFHLYWNYFAKNYTPPTSYDPGTVAVLAWAGHSNYWHWFHDTLGRFHLLQQSGITIDKYVLPPLKLPYHWETVEKLGIPKDKIIQLTPGMHLRARNLILPSIPFNVGTCVKWTIDFLRESFLNQESVKNSSEFERIYISREDASWRKVINEAEVMNFLEKKGFKKIVLNSLSVQEQINIFSSAKFIIASNGAGLTNITFCNPGTKIIQLFTKTSDEFMKIGNYIGLDYYFLSCSVAYPLSTEHEVMNNLIVNVEKLSKMLEGVGIQ